MDGYQERSRSRPILARAFGVRREPAVCEPHTAPPQCINQFGFLAVPLKKTSDVDLVKPLTTFFTTLPKASSAPPVNPVELRKAVEAFNRLRTRACLQSATCPQFQTNSLAEYYDQLTAFERNYEHSSSQHLEGFKWNDAFDTGKSFLSKMQSSVADTFLERAAVLFNYGAILSQTATSQSFLTDENTKTATKLFQQSAGIFAHLRELIQLSGHRITTTDLLPSTLATLSNMMLAQAQEAFYRKAYADKMNPSAMVKIAAQAGDLYSEASKAMDLSKGYWKKEWLNTVSGKAFAFQAVAELHQAQVHWERHEVGERLSRLKHAFELVEKMKRRLTLACLREQVAEIESAYKSSTNENRLIYHERIPDYFALPALPRAPLAKALPVNNPLYAGSRDVFATVMPTSTATAVKKFNSMKAERLRELQRELHEHTELMDGITASLEVPDVIPNDVKRKCKEVRDAGGTAKLNKKLEDLSALHRQNSDILDTIDRVLVEENKSDSELRKLTSDCVRIRSDELVGPFIQEVSKHMCFLKDFFDEDKALRILFEAEREAIDMLSKNENKLRALLPSPPSYPKNGVSESTSAFLKFMDRAKAIKYERNDVIKEINCKLVPSSEEDLAKNASDFLQIDDDDYIRRNVEQVCQAVNESAKASIKKQECLLRDIENWSIRYSDGDHGGDMSERCKLLKSLHHGYDVYKGIQKKLDDKLKAYGALVDRLRRLQTKVNDFSFARQTEKEELIRKHKAASTSKKDSDGSSFSPQPSVQSVSFNSSIASQPNNALTVTQGSAGFPLAHPMGTMLQPAFQMSPPTLLLYPQQISFAGNQLPAAAQVPYSYTVPTSNAFIPLNTLYPNDNLQGDSRTQPPQ